MSFDSVGEFDRYKYLRLLELAKEITDFVFKPQIQLTANGFEVAKFNPDFFYKKDGVPTVDDFKGYIGRNQSDFMLRCKFFKASNPDWKVIISKKQGKGWEEKEVKVKRAVKQ